MTSSAEWDGADYSRHADHHRAADAWFLARHRPAETDVVVDLGCGTGEFSAHVATLVPHGMLIGIDADSSMLAAAQERTAANLRFVRSPAENVDTVVEPSSVDFVMSRAMLHWLPRDLHLQLFTAIRRVLRPGGVMHLEGAGPGNILRITPVIDELALRFGLRPPPGFPDPGTAMENLEAAGLEIADGGVTTVAQRRSFTREQVVGMVRTQATVVLTRQLPADRAAALVEEAAARVEEMRRHDGSYDQTFVRLDLLARRPE